ncbi:hypothetical protein HD597_003785 [Nonomuraea thailandensis]|uniref:Uncharacterized protein n=1 Tax=Nonomuraea thailandensis TaxID=1188745 RepID=A0A9X2GFL6_9ACTN|nr:hypothetical protein [Nonomuraea thailandensis]MCP2356765.1 hypothetical protein [Nonomuraea thailandensis]
MFDLDPVKSILVLALIGLIVLGSRVWRRRRNGVRVSMPMPLFTPVEIQAKAHDLIEAGRFDEAVKVLKKEAEVSGPDALAAARALRRGELLPDFPGRWPEDLTGPVTEFLAQGQRKAAVFLVRDQKRLGPAEAETLVDSLARGKAE